VSPGDIYFTDFGSPLGHEAGFRRPAAVASAEQLAAHGICIVLPVTRTRRG
jgi:mRNA interferase MazF